jgi:hypothetical protein
MTAMTPKLYHGDDATAWHARRWPLFQNPPEISTTLVIQPVYSLSEWGLGRPLDAEEVVGSELLRRALEPRSPTGGNRLVLPPLRLTPRQSVGSCFGLPIETAHQVLTETIRSATLPGYRKFVLFNTSPFLEEWIDVAARDLHVTDQLAMYCMNLSGLGLDFHPVRGGTRSILQTILSHLLGTMPEEEVAIAGDLLDPIPEAAVRIGQPSARMVGESPDEILDALSRHLAKLLLEVEVHSLHPTPAPAESEVKL